MENTFCATNQPNSINAPIHIIKYV
jgi:hypothetical protein